ncbi:peptidase E [bacterium]|nr:peptidase E [bacterium]
MTLNVWFYSSDDSEVTLEMDIDLYNSLKSVHPKITFIPSHHENDGEHYGEFKHRFDRLGNPKHYYLPVDSEISKSSLLKAMDSDMIYLDGGNTYYFLWHLKKSGMLDLLEDFVREGGVIAGTSAGGIILTPDIRTAGFPEFDKDDNWVGLNDISALGVVGFEFFPHFSPHERYVKELARKSEETNMPIYAAPDGGGIWVHGKKIIFYDNCFSFFDGKVTPLNPMG